MLQTQQISIKHENERVSLIFAFFVEDKMGSYFTNTEYVFSSLMVIVAPNEDTNL